MKRARIVVTAEHIAAGKRRGPEFCPVALAARDAGLSVGFVGGMYLWSEDEDYNIPLTKTIRRFVEAFDSGRPVKPATFLLPLPE